MTSLRFGTGHFPSPPSVWDYDAQDLIGGISGGGSVPDRSEILLPFTQIHNQLSTNTCVWQAIAQAVHVLLKSRDQNSDIWLSTLFGYYNTLREMGRGIVDKGCIARIALDVISKQGYCLDQYWPFDPAKVLNEPLPNSYTFANDQKGLVHYYRLFGTGQDLILQVKQALSQGYPVIYASPIGKEYDQYVPGTILRPPTGPWLGSHMRCLVGYTPEYAIEANSWGDWGNEGFGYIGWDFIAWEHTADFWVIDAAPQPSG